MQSSKEELSVSRRNPSGGSTPLTIELNDFKLDLIIQGDCLRIEGENITTSQFFSKTLTEGEITSISSNVLTTAEDLFDLIYFASQEQNSNATVAISETGQITISQVTKIGNRDRTLSYKIDLEPQNLPPLDTCKKFLSKLEQRKDMSQFEKQQIKIMTHLVAHCMNVEQQLELANEKIKGLQEKKEGSEKIEEKKEDEPAAN